MIHFHQVNLTFVDLSKSYRYDRDSMGGGLLLYIRDDIVTKILKPDFGINIENLSVKITLGKRKWFFNCSYNPHQKISNHVNYLNLVSSKCSKVYDHFTFKGDFNVPMSEKTTEDFCSLDNLENLIEKPRCYENHENPTCIDLILANRPSYFQRRFGILQLRNRVAKLSYAK